MARRRRHECYRIDPQRAQRTEKEAGRPTATTPLENYKPLHAPHLQLTTRFANSMPRPSSIGQGLYAMLRPNKNKRKPESIS